MRVRTRRWLVEGERERGAGLTSLTLACVDDDAQGETAEIVWAAELDGELLGDEGWSAVARSGTDDPAVFAAYLKTLTWSTATAGDRDLFQAPFRAGIRLAPRLGSHWLCSLRAAARRACRGMRTADPCRKGRQQ